MLKRPPSVVGTLTEYRSLQGPDRHADVLAMRLVSTSDLQEDTTLARDILTGRDAAPLLRAGVKLNARFIEHLHRAGIQGVYVEDQFSQGIEAHPVIGDQTRGLATRAIAAPI